MLAFLYYRHFAFKLIYTQSKDLQIPITTPIQ
jgi:hypothetical protein